MPRFELASILVETGTGVVGGGVQRMAWQASQMIGLFATGGLMLGGVLIQSMVDQPLLQQVGKAAAISGATVAGWVATEKFLIAGPPRTPLGRLAGAQQQRAIEEARRRSLVEARGGHDGIGTRSFALHDPNMDRDRTEL